MAKKLRAEIIAIGTEILLGEITDTNSGYIASELRLLGIEPDRITVVGDDRAELCSFLNRALSRSDLVITTGGLGPTPGDLTRECMANVLRENLTLDAELEKHLRFLFESQNREMPASNLKQVMIIPSTKPIPNNRGTALGWWVEKNNKVIVVLPGPPREIQLMWQNEVRPRMLARFRLEPVLTRTFKTSNLGEARLGEMLAPLFNSSNPSLGIYARQDGIHIRLVARGNKARELLDAGEKQIMGVMQEYIWGKDNDALPVLIGALLGEQKLNIAIVDNGTRGVLASLLASDSSCVKFFTGGKVVCSSPESSPPDGELAKNMAENARLTFSAALGLGITGVTGFDCTGEIPGLIYIGLSYNGGQKSWRQTLIPHPDTIRQRAAVATLFYLRQWLSCKARPE